MHRRIKPKPTIRAVKAATLRAGVMGKLLIEYGVPAEVTADPTRSNQYTWDRGANIGGLSELARRFDGHRIRHVNSEEGVKGFESRLALPVACRTRLAFDPIDNSSEKNPTNFTSSLALIDGQGKVIIACTYSPPASGSSEHTLFVAAEGVRPYRQVINLDLEAYRVTKLETPDSLYQLNRALDPIFADLRSKKTLDLEGESIRVSDIKCVEDARVGISSRPDDTVGRVLESLKIPEKNIQKIRGAVRKGTYVACGELDVFLETPTQDEPDIAGVIGLVLMSGGKVTNGWGEPLRLLNPHERYKTGMVFSNGTRHTPFQRALEEEMRRTYTT